MVFDAMFIDRSYVRILTDSDFHVPPAFEPVHRFRFYTDAIDVACIKVRMCLTGGLLIRI